jgi:cytochrome c peroxidase
MLTEGMTLPDATFPVMGEGGLQSVSLAGRLKGRRVVIFAVPGAFTPTCDAAHMPGFVRKAAEFRAKGIDEILCVSVNDPHVMRHWGRQTGALEAGITLLADPGAEFTRAVGMEFSAPERGMLNRSRRYAMLVEDGVVRVLHQETAPGVCEVSGAEAMLTVV